MKPAPFRLLRPRSSEEALSLISDLGNEAVILAGGQDLIPALSARSIRPRFVVSLQCAGMDGISADGDRIRVGAMTTHSSLEDNAVFDADAATAVLSAIARRCGPRAVRLRGTIGGNLASRRIGVLWPAALIALSAHAEVLSSSGITEVPVQEYVRSRRGTASEPHVLTAVRLPGRKQRLVAGRVQLPLAGTSQQAVCAVRRESGDSALGVLIVPDTYPVVARFTMGPAGVSTPQEVLAALAARSDSTTLARCRYLLDALLRELLTRVVSDGEADDRRAGGFEIDV